MTLNDKITAALKDAMKAKDQVTLRALRAIKSAILLEKTKAGGGDELDEATEIKLLQKMTKQRKDSIAIFDEQGRNDLSEKEVEELKVIETFLPKQLSEEELTTALKEIVIETGATSMKDMGKIMGLANQKFAGKADGKAISTVVKKLLANS